MKTKRLAAALVLSVLVAGPATAQATRTWVSGVGDDANPCSRTAPCKTFAGAISKTAAGGEINVLDPGGFGAVTITKAISIESDSILAGVLVSGTNGIIVAAGATDTVVLRGLTFDGVGSGLNGIHWSSGGSLVIEKCTIKGFAQAGIDARPTNSTGAAKLFVTDTEVRDNAGGGILIKPTNTAVDATIIGVHLNKNLFGIRTEDNSFTNVKNVIAAQSVQDGFLAHTSTANAAVIYLDGATANNNTQVGVHSFGATSYIFVGDSVITGNNFGFFAESGGQILSWGTNRIGGNSTLDGSPTSTISLH